MDTSGIISLSFLALLVPLTKYFMCGSALAHVPQFHLLLEIWQKAPM